jgi:predicted hydrocarbon binding protein
MGNDISYADLAYPNKLGRFYLIALQDVLRQSGFVALLNWVGLSHYAESLPPNNWERGFDFSDLARLDAGLSDLYGPRAGRQLGFRSGQRFFERGLKGLGYLSGLGDLALRTLPMHTKSKLGLNALARFFNQRSDQGTHVEEQTLFYSYHVYPCPVCWDRKAREPVCYFMAGMLQEAMGWLNSGQNFRVREALCIAAGNDQCVFRIDKQPVK